jgi:hypothetical protein
MQDMLEAIDGVVRMRTKQEWLLPLVVFVGNCFSSSRIIEKIWYV